MPRKSNESFPIGDLEVDAWIMSATKGKAPKNSFDLHKHLKRRYPIRMALLEELFTWMARRANAINGMSKDDARWLL